MYPDVMENFKKKSGRGEKLEQLIRNTLRVVCSNAVPYGAVMSIDALIGITVDSSEVILVNVHEQLDSPGSQLSTGNRTSGNQSLQHSVKSEPFDGTGDASLHLIEEQFTATGPHSSEYSVSQYSVSGPAGLSSYGQPFSDVNEIAEYDNGDNDFGYEEVQNLDGYQDSQTAEFGDEYFTDFDAGMTDGGGGDVAAGSAYVDDIKPFNMPVSQLSGYYRQKAKASAGSRGRRRHTAAQMALGRRPGSKSGAPHLQQKAAMTDEGVDYGESVVSRSQGIATSEKMTVYTCSMCGKMFRHAGSFQRHKQQHEGVVFRCDLCGTVLSRRDVLNAHRRKCEAKLMQQQSFDNM